jgi:hypothetical protein
MAEGFRSHFSVKKTNFFSSPAAILLVLAALLFLDSKKEISDRFSSNINFYYLLGGTLVIMLASPFCYFLRRLDLRTTSCWIRFRHNDLWIRRPQGNQCIPVRSIQKIYISTLDHGATHAYVQTPGFNFVRITVQDKDEFQKELSRRGIASGQFGALELGLGCFGIYAIFYLLGQNRTLDSDIKEMFALAILCMVVLFIKKLNHPTNWIVIRRNISRVTKTRSRMRMAFLTIVYVGHLLFYHAFNPIAENDIAFEKGVRLLQTDVAQARSILEHVSDTTHFPKHLDAYAKALSLYGDIPTRDYQKAIQLSSEAYGKTHRNLYAVTAACAEFGQGHSAAALQIVQKLQIRPYVRAFTEGKACGIRGQTPAAPSLLLPDRAIASDPSSH